MLDLAIRKGIPGLGKGAGEVGGEVDGLNIPLPRGVGVGFVNIEIVWGVHVPGIGIVKRYGRSVEGLTLFVLIRKFGLFDL